MNADLDVTARATGVVWITINRADKHNALAGGVLDALATAVRAAGEAPGTRLVAIRGAGNRFFAAGGDLVELASVRAQDEIHAMADRARAALDAVRECAVPVIAYLNGDAIGGGAELAVACDMRVFAPHARLGFVQGRMGISTAWGGGPDLCALVGPARATRLMSRCEMLSAPLALAWGLADVEVSDGPEGADMQAFIQPMLDRSRGVMKAIKAQASAWRGGLGNQARRDIEREHVLATWTSDEHWAAVDRFLSKEKT